MNGRSQSLPRPFAGLWLQLRRIRPAVLLRSAAPPSVRLGGAFLQLLATILIARTLGAARAGDFFFWSTIIRSCGQVSTFGLDRLALQRVPLLAEDPAALSRFLAPIRVTSMLLAIGLAGAVSCYALFVQSDVPRPGWWYLLPPAAMMGVALCMINGEIMTGLGRPVLGVAYRHTSSVAIFVLALLIAGSGLTSVQALICFSTAFAVAGFGALLAPGLRHIRPNFRIPSRAEFKSHLTLGFPICLSSIFASLNFMIPLALLERNHPTEQIAYLTTAYRIFMLFEVLAMAAYAIAMPELSRAADSRDRSRFWRVYRSSVIRGFLLFGPATVAAFFFAGPIMSVFGPGFGEAGNILQVFLVFGLASLLCGPATYLLLMVGETRRMATYSFTRLASTCVLSFLVIPAFGPIGMAAVLGIGFVVEKILCLRRAVIATNAFPAG